MRVGVQVCECQWVMMTGVIIVSFLVSFIRLLFYCICPSFLLFSLFHWCLVSMKNRTHLGEKLPNEVKTNEFQLTEGERERGTNSYFSLVVSRERVNAHAWAPEEAEGEREKREEEIAIARAIEEANVLFIALWPLVKGVAVLTCTSLVKLVC